ncbi:MAG: cell division protein FtsZ [Gammaproteobacteria bacterium]|nr:cell division protein FtsZ [Gammaproteobacteria bacterium]
MFELVDDTIQNVVIKVIGVGGGGGNAVEHMVSRNIDGVEFISANTDIQALQRLTCETQLQLGSSITRGLGAGANPVVGKESAIEDRDRIAKTIQGADMLFITAGMGGGTGTGAAPVVAEVARELGILTVAVVTKPFVHEGRKRMQIAETGIAEISEHVDSLITIPNERLLTVMDKDTPLEDAWAAVDDVLLRAVQGISDLIIRPGKINVDFADVKTVMGEMGMAMMGSGTASGENRVREATEFAVKSPLLENIDLKGAKGILVNIAAGENISLGEYAAVLEEIQDLASEDATQVIGTVINPEMGEELRVSVVATGLRVSDEMEKAHTLTKEVKKKVAGDGPIDYTDFDKPTIMRNQVIQGGVEGEVPGGKELEYLDIPAFLRRQAD